MLKDERYAREKRMRNCFSIEVEKSKDGRKVK